MPPKSGPSCSIINGDHSSTKRAPSLFMINSASAEVRFVPKSGQMLRYREMTQWDSTRRERAELGGDFRRSHRRSASRLWSLGHHGTS
jgi:hypothetical protein